MVIKTECPHCKGSIEYGLETAGHTVSCPHCNASILLKVPSEPKRATPAPMLPDVQVVKLKPAKPPFRLEVLILSLASIAIFFGGLALAAFGLLGEISEQSVTGGSAIRQAVYAIQYGTGFVLVALSLILSGIIRLIQKP